MYPSGSFTQTEIAGKTSPTAFADFLEHGWSYIARSLGAFTRRRSGLLRKRSVSMSFGKSAAIRRWSGQQLVGSAIWGWHGLVAGLNDPPNSRAFALAACHTCA